MGDMLMHSLDTVKTRQQGDPHMPPKYTSMGSTYRTIWKQEGVTKGLYGGALPALLGSFSGTCIFFGSYEFGKRALVDMGVNPTLAYFAAGTVTVILTHVYGMLTLHSQDSWPILPHHPFTFPQKFSKRAFNYKVDITILIFTAGTTTKA